MDKPDSQHRVAQGSRPSRPAPRPSLRPMDGGSRILPESPPLKVALRGRGPSKRRGNTLARSFRFTARSTTVTLAVAIATAAVGLGLGAQGAVGSSQAAASINARHVSAKALGRPQLVNLASLPKQQQVRSSGRPQAMPFLSPLGATRLAQARADVSLAPRASVNMRTPARSARVSTPGGATTGFNGMADSATICSYFGAGCQPPDMAIAANTKTVVQAVNTSIAMYKASTGALLAGFPKSLQTFFGVPAPSPAGCDSAHGNQPFLSDPRALIDPTTGRFAVAALQVEGAFDLSPSCTFVSRYWVAVSATKDPTGAWHVYAFNTANLVGTPSAADYTQLGFDSEAFFIGGNQFNQPGTAYNGAWTLAIPKATAEAGGAIGSISGFAGYTASDGTAIRLLDTVQPVTSLGAGAGGPAGEILIAAWKSSGPSARLNILETLSTRQEWTQSLLTAVETGKISPGEIGTVQQQKLLNHPQASIRERAGRLFNATTDRQTVLKRLSPSLMCYYPGIEHPELS